MATIVLELPKVCNCKGCNDKIKKVLKNIKGIESSTINLGHAREHVTVKGIVDPVALVKALKTKLKTTVTIRSVKTEQDQKQKEVAAEIAPQPKTNLEVGESSIPRENMTGGISTPIYMPMGAQGQEYGHGYGQGMPTGGQGYGYEYGYGYGQVHGLASGYEYDSHDRLKPVYAPETFSDENASACSVM